MPPNRRPMRYAHADGHTDVCYSQDGKYILTCGSDGDVRIWAGLEDDDSTSQCVGEKALAVTQKGSYFYVGTDNNNVQAYTFPDANRDQIVTRFSAPVTHVAVSENGKKVFSGSFDTEIHITDLDTSQSQVLSGHTAPVLSVAVDPAEKYLVSSSCDGTARVWSLDTLETEYTWQCIPVSNSFYTTEVLCRPSWQPTSGRYLALPEDRNVRLYERASWRKVASLGDEKARKAFSICAFSPCGQYIAGATTGGDICIWNVNSQSKVVIVQHDQTVCICGLVWNPLSNGEIAYCDFTGQLGTVEDCLPVEEAKVTEIVNGIPAIDRVFENEEEDDAENVFSLEKIKASVAVPTQEGSTLGDELDIPDALDDEDDIESKKSTLAKADLLDVVCEVQAPFQPSSSPVHLQHRYMVWNSVGIVRCHDTEEENSIDVEFHDTSVHHSIHMPNFLKHTLAALTEEILVLACEAQEESSSKVVCVLLSSWDGSREWTVEMPAGEEVLAVAAGQGWLAAATDIRNLRLFTSAGTQREVVSLPGPVVCLAGRQKQLMVVCHGGAGLIFSLIAVRDNVVTTVSAYEQLPLAPKAQLHWVGFTDEGTPCTTDSAGVVRFLSRKGYWSPVCDTSSQTSGKSDHYFVLGVSERYQNVRCVLCKGARYPPTVPRPAVVELSLKIPLCEEATEKAGLEEKFWRSQLLLGGVEALSRTDDNYLNEKDAIETTIKETIIKLFALACKSGLEQRAAELGALMPSQQVLQLAMKYATKVGKHHLADRLSEDAAKRERERLTPEITAIMSGSGASHKRYVLESSESQNGWSSSNGDAVTDDYDPFASTPTNNATPEHGNLLLAAKQRKNSVPEIRPTLSLSQRKHNPFRKNAERREIGKGLENMNNAFLEKQNSKNKQNSTETAQPTVKTKQTKLMSKPSNAQEPASKSPLPFVQWFQKERPAMQEEFPDMNSSELTREAMKRYKEVRQKQKEQQQEQNGECVQKLGSFENWFEEEKSNLQKEFPGVTQQELATEGLKRYRDLLQKKRREEKEKEAASKSDYSESVEVGSESKKRKAQEEAGSQDKVAKILSSDIAQFAFKKS
ncbi:WD repeat and HMG-box DNA-binding protein 1 isoform X1 [Schistocerca cancellata]|uniref:WD repeat and HMG-box DNA-binding protein 1 isoform X1 n=1 Tax=Schistocerca cancellata TaxID=274614 RepID=UPI002117FFCC|nr:WD repeat and HMG-box DNA-binding protein 1 isoform X1 [Schistocerca cancellata]